MIVPCLQGEKLSINALSYQPFIYQSSFCIIMTTLDLKVSVVLL